MESSEVNKCLKRTRSSTFTEVKPQFNPYINFSPLHIGNAIQKDYPF